MDNPYLSIVLPTYNERRNIAILVPLIEEAFKNIKFEIIVVDDNSPDHTAESALELNKKYGNINLVSRKYKEGIGAALQAGYAAARGEIILSSDADLSFLVSDMQKLLEGVEQGFDLVVGCRHTIKGSYYELKGLRTTIKGLISKTGNSVLRFLSGIDLHDFSANFRAIKRDCWLNINAEEKSNFILFEMIIKAKYKNMKIAEVPVHFFERTHGDSKLNILIEILKYMPKIVYNIFKYKLNH